MGFTTTFTRKMKKSELIELLNKVHDEKCELRRYCDKKDESIRNANTESAMWRKKFEDAQHQYRWLKEDVDKRQKENEELKKQMDKQHEEIQQIKDKLKEIIDTYRKK
tara:strand:- start:169 stop:492 length:324 start_codon:yes stop_codon:yes gene_type:complete